jgi:putative FmdB family regulatory protein
MPLYEYICEQDGATIELLRPMGSADDPVEDPEHRGRTFRRVQSTFAAASGGRNPEASGRSLGGGCPCGRPGGSCGSN